MEAEDTLAMIKSALKSGTGKMVEELGAVDGADGAVPSKKKKTTTKKKKKDDVDMPKLEPNTYKTVRFE